MSGRDDRPRAFAETVGYAVPTKLASSAFLKPSFDRQPVRTILRLAAPSAVLQLVADAACCRRTSSTVARRNTANRSPENRCLPVRAGDKATTPRRRLLLFSRSPKVSLRPALCACSVAGARSPDGRAPPPITKVQARRSNVRTPTVRSLEDGYPPKAASLIAASGTMGLALNQRRPRFFRRRLTSINIVCAAKQYL
jgi:hypothetical protein